MCTRNEVGLDLPAAVLDNGGCLLKCALSGGDYPQYTVPTCLGCPGDESPGPENYYVGHEAQEKRDVLKLKYPIERGEIQDWDSMTKIWTHVFDNEFRAVVGSKEQPYSDDIDVAGVLITEPPLNPKKNRERTTEIMFETFCVPRFYMHVQAVLALFATGRTTGVAVDCGDGVSHSVPIFEGYIYKHCVRRNELGGRDLTEYLNKILIESQISCGQTWSANAIKEYLCYVSMNFNEEVDNFAGKEKTFELPDMSVVTVHNQMIRCPELMFKPSMDGKDMMGLHQMVKEGIDHIDPSDTPTFLKNVVMFGGSSMFPNMPERLQAEIEALDSSLRTVQVHAPPERMISAWIGGSILCSLGSFTRGWIHIESHPDANPAITGYGDIGPRIVHQMCGH